MRPIIRSSSEYCVSRLAPSPPSGAMGKSPWFMASSNGLARLNQSCRRPPSLAGTFGSLQPYRPYP